MEEEIIDYIPLIGDLYRGWRIGNTIASLFSSNDDTDEILAQMIQMINAAVEEENIEKKINIVEQVFELAKRVNGQKKYQQAVMGYTLIMGGYIGAISYWQTNLWNLDARKELDEYFNNILEGCTSITDISITWFTDNDELVRNVQERVDNLANQVRETKKEMHKHYWRVDKMLHPWKYRLMWMIPLILLLFTAWGYVCYLYL